MEARGFQGASRPENDGKGWRYRVDRGKVIFEAAEDGRGDLVYYADEIGRGVVRK